MFDSNFSPLQYFTSAELAATMSKDELLELFQKNFLFDLLYLLRIVDSFRSWSNAPIRLTSTYRNLKHNQSVGGSPTSQHMLGQAVDFQFSKDSNFTSNMFKNFLIQKKSLYFNSLGQVILYPTFVHIARPNKTHPKLEIIDKRTNPYNLTYE